jgi:replicative DNA helicase
MNDTATAESAVLALCFKNPQCHRRAVLELTPEHFTDPGLRNVWNAASKHEAPLDITLIAQTMHGNGTLAEFGGKAKLAAFKFNGVADPDRFDEYIAALHTARNHKRLSATLEKAREYVINADADLPVIAARVSDMVNDAVRASITMNEGSTMNDVLAAAYIETHKASERTDGIVGYRTYIGAIDEMIGGFEPGHVTTIMGEPGSGKTALALQACVGISRHAPVGFISLEMTHADLGQRIQASVSRAQFGRIRAGTVPREEAERINTVSVELSQNSRLWVAPSTIETWDESVAWITHMHFTHGVRVFILDNILSLDYQGKEEYEHVTRVAGASQRLVRKLNIALVNLHHTNTSEKPALRSVHGAKAIARHSSNVLALWREDPEGPRVYLMELKGRNTGRGERLLQFIGAQQRFTEGVLA